MNKTSVLHFDCIGGVAGDMLLAAMIDLGLPFSVVEEAIAALPIAGFRIRTEKTKRSTVDATRFIVDVAGEHQPHRHYGHIREMIETSDLAMSVKTRAMAIFEVIAKAEARVHGTTIDKVHFHEVGAVDSIVDIVGAAAGLDYFNATITASPLPLGTGTTETAHGILPVPAPATLFLLEGFPVYGPNIKAELTTPTGAAVIKASVGAFTSFPQMTVRRVGFGAGTRTHEKLPGLLRAVLGESEALAVENDTVVIEANIDDMTGEMGGHLKRTLLEAAALDVWLTPIQMKKERPALKIGVLCRRMDLERLAAVLFRESSTIGLRFYGVGRIEMSRETRTVVTPYGAVRVKVSKGLGVVNAAPEFDDCAAIAKKKNVPLKQVLASAHGAASQLIVSDV